MNTLDGIDTIKEVIRYANQNPNEYNNGFVSGVISIVYNLGLVTMEQLEDLGEEMNFDKRATHTRDFSHELVAVYVE